MYITIGTVATAMRQGSEGKVWGCQSWPGLIHFNRPNACRLSTAACVCATEGAVVGLTNTDVMTRAACLRQP